MSPSSGAPYSHARSSSGYPPLGRTPPSMGPPPRSSYDYDHRLPPISAPSSQQAPSPSPRYPYQAGPVSSSSYFPYHNSGHGGEVSSPHSSAGGPATPAGPTAVRPGMRESSANSSPAAADTPDSAPGHAPSAAITGSARGLKGAASRSAGKQALKQQQQQEVVKDGASASEAPKRKKKAVSCENCRRRKLKCDRGFPCGACRDRDEADLCAWEGGTRPQAMGRDQSNTPLLMRMDRLERLLGTIATKMGVDDSAVDSGEALDGLAAGAAASTSALPAMNSHSKRRRTSDPDTRPSSKRSTSSEQESLMSLWPLNWTAPTLDQQRAELFKVMEMLPDTGSVRRLCTYWFKEFGWNTHIIDEEDFWQRGLREHEELRVMWQGNRDFHSRLGPKDNVRGHLQFVAILCGMCGFTLLNNDQDFRDVALLIDQDFVPGYFFEASTRAFNASAPFDEPTLDSIRVLILHCWFTMCFRGTHVGTAVLAMALSQMQALELDFEPPPSMPRKQAMDRLNLFVSLASLDWSSCISFKRSYSLQEEPVKMPYLFGERTLSFKDYDEERELVTLHRRIALEMARLNRRIASRAAMTEEDAWDETVRIQADLDRLYMSLPFIEYETIMQEEMTEIDHTMQGRMTLLVTISITLVNLHKRYYIQGWLNPAYRTSKEICFVSSRRICGLFRKSFGTVLPIEQVMSMSVDEIRSFMEKNARFVTRMWPFSHASISACLLLRHHIAMMDAHPTAAGPNAEQVRNDIIEDLRVTMRLLLAVSTRSQVARTGVAVLAHSNSSRKIAELGTRPPLQGFTPGPPRSPRNRSAATAAAVSRSGSDSAMARKRQRELAADLKNITGFTDGNAFDLSSASSSSSSSLQAPQAVHPMTSTASRNNYEAYDSQSAAMPLNQTSSSSAPATVVEAAPPPDNDAYRQLETFLNGAFQTDTYTGQPLAPEMTFERQADRIGAAAPPLLPGAIPRPMSPFTSAFMGSWDNTFNVPADNGTDGSTAITTGAAPQAGWY